LLQSSISTKADSSSNHSVYIEISFNFTDVNLTKEEIIEQVKLSIQSINDRDVIKDIEIGNINDDGTVVVIVYLDPDVAEDVYAELETIVVECNGENV